MSITFTELKVSMPFTIKQIIDLTIIEKVNEHSMAEMVCIMDDTEDIDLLFHMTIKDMVKVEYKTEESFKTLFVGYPIRIDIEVTGGIYYLRIKLTSATIQMDFKKKSRSFQDKSKPFSQVIRTIFRQGYEGLCYFIDEGLSQNKVMIQCEETDWEFIKRVASHWNAPIITNAREGKPTVFLGVPNGKIYEEACNNFIIKNEIASYLHDNANIGKFMRLEYISYEIESHINYELGDRIRYNKIEFVIFEKTASMDKGELKFQYGLKVEEGVRQNLMIHKGLQGSSFVGRVIDCKEDLLKVHLLMDGEQSQSGATWFQLSTIYSAERNTGVYIMPEIGDLVSLYLPVYNEDKGFIRYSIREKWEEAPIAQIPENRCFGTVEHGLMLLSTDKVEFSKAKDGAISIIELNSNKGGEGGVQVGATSNIKISSKNIAVSGKTVTLSAEHQLILGTDSSSIVVDKIIQIKGDNGVNI